MKATEPVISDSPPKEAQRQGHQQQAKTASNPPLTVQQPNAAHSQAGQGCPGTSEHRFDCNSVSAIANVRQAAAAEWFNNLAVAEIGVGLFTAFVAALAARWAKHAAEAGIKSYKAFVAAEDAHLVLDFEQGPFGQWTGEDGVTKANYSFTITVSNVGRSAARLQQVIIENPEGSMARSFGETLKPDGSINLSDWLLIMADEPKANVRISYATSLHPITHFDAVVGMDVQMGGRRATAYIISSRIGRPKTK